MMQPAFEKALIKAMVTSLNRLTVFFLLLGEALLRGARASRTNLGLVESQERSL